MTKNILGFIILLFFTVYSYAQTTPLTEGIDITMRNTLQDAGEEEATYASLFGEADDAYDEFATLSNTTSEFPTALAQSGTPAGDINGLYDIDFTDNSINFSVIAEADDPFWTNVFGLFPEGKFDRYYFTFSEPHNITSFTSDNPNLNLRIDSETVIVVELTGGYDVQPGVSFTVNLNPPPSIVVEVTLFDLNAGVDGDVFKARDLEIEQEFASQQPGFLKRLSGVDANGQYVVMVFWETLADADASIAAFGVDPTVADYFAMIDAATFSAERYTTFTVPDIAFTMIENNVIEITTFNLNAGVNPAVFIARDAEIEQDFASLQPGFVRRTSGVDANGKYAVIVFWETLADADASIEAFGVDPTVGDYFAMIDAATFAADRYTIFDGIPSPLTEGIDITMRNTLQDAGEEEATYASLFGEADDAYDEFATLSNTTSEFPTALAQSGTPAGDINGLYDIDFTDNSINFSVIAEADDPFWTNVFGLFPEGKFDRYYFTFSEPHNITSFTSDNPNLNLRIDSETVIVVELTGGYDVQPGVSFTVNLNPPPSIVVEVTLFDLNAGVDGDVFKARDLEIEQEFASQQPGFLKRLSGVDANGQYVVMVFWETLADADASIAAFGVDPTVADYFAMIDAATFSAERYTTFTVPDIAFTMIENNVIEITTFNLNAGVNPAVFIARDAEIEQDFASLQPGFVRRTSGVDANGKYAVIVFWETLADADASIEAFGVDPTVGDYFAMIDAATFAADRYTIFVADAVYTENIVAQNSNVNISPNPFIDIAHFEIQLSETGKYHFQVFDITGKVVNSQMLDLNDGINKFSFDGGHLMNGVYNYRLSNTKGFISGKMIVVD